MNKKYFTQQKEWNKKGQMDIKFPTQQKDWNKKDKWI